jgi:hypothetical protein
LMRSCTSLTGFDRFSRMRLQGSDNRSNLSLKIIISISNNANILCSGLLLTLQAPIQMLKFPQSARASISLNRVRKFCVKLMHAPFTLKNRATAEILLLHVGK